ncbi:MAG: 30S ribosomal protein S1 [Ruminococcus sp.]|nr:30S ribosomal protein S1 [Ruminococcus sp.]
MTGYLPEGKLINTTENIKTLSSLSNMQQAKLSQKILEAKATVCDAQHNLIVDLGDMKGIIPREEGAVGIKEGSVRDIAVISRVNRPVSFVITDFTHSDSGAPVALLSREKAQRRCIDEYISTLKVGDVVPARITHLETFGAFADIGCGVVALMPIDSISVSRIEHPKERFKVGMDVKAIIKSIENGRISLSHKELLGTWEENVAKFSVGETVTGIVRSVENYGAFVELTPNLAGLAELKDTVKVGQLASVYIKSIIPSKMKVKLILIDTFDSESSVKPPRYYYKENHIEKFVYSPIECEKYIATEF